ncbi:hypothetical protein diail_10534 [Diaporthe ilicicola]|nr:hypothetical protein diail_10534 [Diaporthe ilicicola]
MCVIVKYACQHCRQETGQRDYVRHTDGQRFAIPDPEMEVVSFCTDLSPLRVTIQKASLQSPYFPCMNPGCAGMKTRFDKKEYDDEEARIVGLVSATAAIAVSEGMQYNNVAEMLQEMGVQEGEMQDLPDAKLEQWTGLAEDRVKMGAEAGETVNEVNAALQAMTGLKYSNHGILVKASRLELKRSQFGAVKDPLAEADDGAM